MRVLSANRCENSTWRLPKPRRNPGKRSPEISKAFSSFVQKKTEQIRKQYGCEAVEYTVEMQNGQVKLKAKAKT